MFKPQELYILFFECRNHSGLKSRDVDIKMYTFKGMPEKHLTLYLKCTLFL